jgi:hypothetical protein
MLAILALNNDGPKANKTITTADVINISKREAKAVLGNHVGNVYR